MTGPFESSPAASGGLGSRLLGRKARGAAARDIEALLAGSPEISEVTADRSRRSRRSTGWNCRGCSRSAGTSTGGTWSTAWWITPSARPRSPTWVTFGRFSLSRIRWPPRCTRRSRARSTAPPSKMCCRITVSTRRKRSSCSGFATTWISMPARPRRAMEEGRRRARQRYLSTVVSSDDILVASQEIKLEIDGSSEESIEGAVSDALAEAATVLPGLKRVVVASLEADIAEGEVSRWHVKLKAVLDKR